MRALLILPAFLTLYISVYSQAPVVKWRIASRAPILASPIVDGNVVYVGGTDSVLNAYDVNTGKKLWSHRTKGQIRSNVLVNRETLFLNGGDGELYALQKQSGRVKWTFKTGGEKKYDFADYFQSTPVLHNELLYFGSGDGNLYCITTDGKLKWKYQTGDAVHTTVAIDNGKVFFGSFDGYVYALQLNDGSLAWRFKTVGHQYFPKGEVQGSPAVAKGLVFIGARDYNVYAINQEKGYCHWNKAFNRGWGLVNTIKDSLLLVGTADQRIFISADPATGREYWRKNMELLVFGGEAFDNELMYVGTTIGKLHAIKVKDGSTAWSFQTEGYKANRKKYFKEDDSFRDDIYTTLKSNEEFLEAQYEVGGIFSTPVVTGNMIIFTSSEGAVYCIEKSR